MADRTPLPIRVTFDGVALPVETTTRSLDTERVHLVVDARLALPAAGTRAQFEVRVGGSTCRGVGHLAGETTIPPTSGTERVIELAILALDAASTERIQRAVFRARMMGHDDKPIVTRRLESPDGTPITSAQVLELSPEPPAAAPTPEPVLKSERRELDAARQRPVRPQRHHWENDDRWRVR